MIQIYSKNLNIPHNFLLLFLISVFLLFYIEFSVFLIAKYLCIAFLLKHFYNDARIQNQLQKCRRHSWTHKFKKGIFSCYINNNLFPTLNQIFAIWTLFLFPEKNFSSLTLKQPDFPRETLLCIWSVRSAFWMSTGLSFSGLPKLHRKNVKF